MYINSLTISKFLNFNERSMCRVIDFLCNSKDKSICYICSKLFSLISYDYYNSNKFSEIKQYAIALIGNSEFILQNLLNDISINNCQLKDTNIKLQELNKTLYNILSQNNRGFFKYNGEGIRVKSNSLCEYYYILTGICQHINNGNDISSLDFSRYTTETNHNLKYIASATSQIMRNNNLSHMAIDAKGETFATLVKLIYRHNSFININIEDIINVRNNVVHKGNIDEPQIIKFLNSYFKLIDHLLTHPHQDHRIKWISNRIFHNLIFPLKSLATDIIFNPTITIVLTIASFFKVLTWLSTVYLIWYTLNILIGRADIEIIDLPDDPATQVRIYDAYITKDTIEAKTIQQNLRFIKDFKNNSYSE